MSRLPLDSWQRRTGPTTVVKTTFFPCGGVKRPKTEVTVYSTICSLKCVSWLISHFNQLEVSYFHRLQRAGSAALHPSWPQLPVYLLTVTSSVIRVAMDRPISWYCRRFPNGPSSRKTNLKHTQFKDVRGFLSVSEITDFCWDSGSESFALASNWSWYNRIINAKVPKVKNLLAPST